MCLQVSFQGTNLPGWKIPAIPLIKHSAVLRSQHCAEGLKWESYLCCSSLWGDFQKLCEDVMITKSAALPERACTHAGEGKSQLRLHVKANVLALASNLGQTLQQSLDTKTVKHQIFSHWIRQHKQL